MILPGALPTLAYSENFPGPLSAFVFSVEEIVLHAVVTDLCVRAAQGHAPFSPGDGGGARESLVSLWCLLGIAVGIDEQYPASLTIYNTITSGIRRQRPFAFGWPMLWRV